LLALQFLTRIPVTFPFKANDQELGQSVLFYPLIGFIIGLILLLAVNLIPTQDVSLKTSILLCIWVLLTGGLHLDGLADCADAWVGGFGDRDKTLRIMKDPAAGPIAIIILVLTLLIKWSALQSFNDHQLSLAIITAPLLGRTAILLLMSSTPYVRKNGLANQLLINFPLATSKLIILSVFLVTTFLLGWFPMILCAGLLLWIRQMAMHRLGGMTGDVYGASVELVEVGVVLGIALA
jgi:adenosylcobinamide-GDP ribazoletransferase